MENVISSTQHICESRSSNGWNSIPKSSCKIIFGWDRYSSTFLTILFICIAVWGVTFFNFYPPKKNVNEGHSNDPTHHEGHVVSGEHGSTESRHKKDGNKGHVEPGHEGHLKSGEHGPKESREKEDGHNKEHVESGHKGQVDSEQEVEHVEPGHEGHVKSGHEGHMESGHEEHVEPVREGHVESGHSEHSESGEHGHKESGHKDVGHEDSGHDHAESKQSNPEHAESSHKMTHDHSDHENHSLGINK